MAKKKSDIADLIGMEPTDTEADAPAVEAAPAAELPPEPVEITLPAIPENDPDGVREAHLIRQKNWEHDAKEIFRGPTEDELRRRKLLEDLAIMESERQAKIRADEAARLAAEEKANAAEKAAELRAKAAALHAEAVTLNAEAKRLEALAKE